MSSGWGGGWSGGGGVSSEEHGTIYAVVRRKLQKTESELPDSNDDLQAETASVLASLFAASGLSVTFSGQTRTFSVACLGASYSAAIVAASASDRAALDELAGALVALRLRPLLREGDESGRTLKKLQRGDETKEWAVMTPEEQEGFLSGLLASASAAYNRIPCVIELNAKRANASAPLLTTAGRRARLNARGC